MYSMTGYGKGIAEKDGNRVTIELKTVNHRYLDFGLKYPKTFLFLEDAIKKQISSRIQRGHIDMFLTYEQTESAKGGYAVDYDLAEQYLRVASEIAQRTSLPNDLTLSSIMRNADILTRQESDEDNDALASLTSDSLAQALDQLVQAREKEGCALHRDLNAKLDFVADCLEHVKSQAPIVAEEYKNRLSQKLTEAIGDKFDQARLLTEVTLFIDKSCIDEEITRLGTHIDIMRKTLNKSMPIGRDLDFRIQEMNRETNTIGSKANSLAITEQVLKIKNEIEKIREQVQNVE